MSQARGPGENHRGGIETPEREATAGETPGPEATHEPSNRPAFSRTFPRDPELDPMVDDFARGDYGSVRARARALVSPSAAVGAAADDLVRRTSPSPGALYLLGLAFALLTALSAWFYAVRPR